MKQLAANLIQSLNQQLGPDLIAAYLYGSVSEGKYVLSESDLNLFLVISQEALIENVRNCIRPFWEAHQTELKRAPLIARPQAFHRHLQLNPALTRHLKQHGRALVEHQDLLSGHTLVDPRADYVHLAWEIMEASLALAPDLLEPEDRDCRLLQLRRLVRRIQGSPLPAGESAASLLARAHLYLRRLESRLPQIQTWQGDRRPTTSLLLPSLRATYKKPDHQLMIMVFAGLTPQQIIDTDWNHLASRLKGQYKGLQIVTATQLRHIVQLHEASAVPLRRYVHEWGQDPLASLEVSQEEVIMDAARLPSYLEVDLLPNTFLTIGEEQVHKLIHDFQNKMLNIQLEHELLHRIEKIEKFVPPEPLPGRQAPPIERVEALFNHFGWWAGFYVDLAAKLD